MVTTARSQSEASSKQVREEMVIQLYRSKLQFFHKFGGQRRARQARALLALAYTPLVVAAVWSSSATTGTPSAGVSRRWSRRRRPRAVPCHAVGLEVECQPI